MAKFSQRMGITEIKDKLQTESMDEELRISLWNILSIVIWKPFEKQLYGRLIINGSNVSSFFECLWNLYFKKTVDSIPKNYEQALSIVRNYFFNAPWYEIYDFIECVANITLKQGYDYIGFEEICNNVLARELSGFRFIDHQIVPINAQEEIDEIEQAINGPLDPIKEHLTRSLQLMADRSNPDYRNSIKEAICAVESMCRIITGEKSATLGEALKRIEKTGTIEMHDALKRAFNNLYGYTNDADGIRHALLEESTLNFEDAKFMLVSCSAFINYLTVKASKVGIKLS